MHNLVKQSHFLRNNRGQFIDSGRHFTANVEHLISHCWNVHAFSNDWRDIFNVGESPLLLSIPVNSHRFAFEALIHEDAYYIAVTIPNALTLSKDVMRPKNNVIQSEHLTADS